MSFFYKGEIMNVAFVYCLSGLGFIFLMTTFGSFLSVVFTDGFVRRFRSVINGLAVGIMVAASVFSLVIPALGESAGVKQVVAVSLGIALGAAFMTVIGRLFGEKGGGYGGFYLAVTAHNVPEGIAVGFAFGAAAMGNITVAAAMAVALGIGVQNFPEGAAISLPARDKYGRKKAFVLGMLSGLVEPIGGLFGFFLARIATVLLPYLMSFAAGAMLYEIFADTEDGDRGGFSVGAVVGFILMMAADVLLG